VSTILQKCKSHYHLVVFGAMGYRIFTGDVGVRLVLLLRRSGRFIL